MEMEAPRRSALDRSREPGTKKPRLAEETERDRGPSSGVMSDRSRSFAQGRPAVGGGNPKFRASEKEERDEAGRGEIYYQQQQQELVAQYRTALAELTFNSKPIITNLTIIAGENLHAAKSIAATVCENVLEVPSEQKLPSLYLLDSIVKNIGRDYIKYFAARLPQVFCKAYKQVEPSIHHSLRHLFGTWKGVFPLSCLQAIENELGFQSITNGSSGGTSTRSDTQAQRPSHSIHVNPKYLEARQRLQQTTKGKEISSEATDEGVASVDGTERSIRAPGIGNVRQWSELSNKVSNVQLPQREQPSDFINERKGYKDIREPGFSSQLSRQQDIGAGRILGRVKDLDEPERKLDQVKELDEPNKPYFESGGEAHSAIYGRNGFDANHVYGNYRTLGSDQNNSQVPSIRSNRMNWPASKNWKASEEEEYIWDDMGSRLANYEGASNRRSRSTDDQDKPTSLQGQNWMSVDTEQVDSRLNKFDAFRLPSKIAEIEDGIHFPKDDDEHYSQHNRTEIEPRTSKIAWPPPLRDPPLPSLGLDHTISRLSGRTELGPHLGGALSTNDHLGMPRSGFQSTLPSSLGPSMDISLSGGILGQQRQLTLQPPSSPTFHSTPLKQPVLHGSIDHDYLPLHSSQIGQKSRLIADQFNRDPVAPGGHDSFLILSENPGQKAHNSLNSQPSLPVTSLPGLSPYSELKQHLSSLQRMQRDPLIPAVLNETSAPLSQRFRANESKEFSRSIDVSTQSNTSNLLATIMKTDILTKKPASDSNIHPPLPSGPPPAQALASSSEMAPHGIAPLLGGMLPPLPPGPPPSTSLVGTTSSQTTNSASISLNPLSSLLSSLVAKGLITSATTLFPTITSRQISKESSSQNSDLDGSTSTAPPPSLKELPVCKPLRVSLASSATEFGDLMGIQFKSEIIREFHSTVIDSLIDDLEHQCSLCGLRFRQKEQLLCHLDWHDTRNSEMNCADKVCRRWYSSIDDWVSGDVEPSCGPMLIDSLETALFDEPLEPMVSADENQSICALCGEPFEDFYSVVRDEWMYKGTVYLNSTGEKCVASGLIVHAKCVSASAIDGGAA